MKSMKRRPDRTGPLNLIVHARDPHTPPVGIRACPPFLAEDLWCLPGESLQQLVHRAKCHTTLQVLAIVMTWLKCRQRPTPPQRYSQQPCNTGAKRPQERGSE